MKHLLSTFLLLLLLFAPSASAEIEEFQESMSDCGDTAWQSRQFFSGTVDTIDIVTPTFDMTKNYCQLEDLNTLENQISTAKRTVERAFMSCNPEKIESAKKDYFRLKIEQYYVKHFVESNSSDQSFFEKGENLEAVPFEKKLYPDMKERFVGKKKWVDEKTLQEYLTELQKKYTDRLEEYQECKSADWDAVGEKFKSFWETMKALFSDPLGTVKNSASGEIEKQEALRDEQHKAGVKSPSDLLNFGSDVKNQGLSTITDGLSKKGELSINNEEPLKGLAEIGKGFESAMPGGSWPWEYFSDDAKEYMGSGSKAPDISSIGNALTDEEQRYASDVMEAEMLSQYEILYGEGADDITASLVADLENLKTTIQNTLPPLQGVNFSTFRANLRQCLNK